MRRTKPVWMGRASGLAAKFIKSDGGGVGHVEAVHGTGRRQFGEPVTILARQAAQPGSFSAQDKGDRSSQVERAQFVT